MYKYPEEGVDKSEFASYYLDENTNIQEMSNFIINKLDKEMQLFEDICDEEDLLEHIDDFIEQSNKILQNQEQKNKEKLTVDIADTNWRKEQKNRIRKSMERKINLQMCLFMAIFNLRL